MDRIEFMQSIIRTNDRSMKDDIIDFFDQEMLLYELIGSFKHTVSVIDYNPKKISFQINGNKQDIHRLTTTLSSIDKVIEYDKPLGVDFTITSNKSIDIHIIST